MSFTPTPINPTTDTVKPSPFIAFTQRVIPATFDQSLSYQEALYALLNYINKLGETVNTNAEVTDAQTKVIEEMTDYLNNYFDNLDVQEEINNKLDAMAESGELEEIISLYLQTTCIWGFNSVSEMLASTNLTNGSFAKTTGFYANNDGGAGFYKIRNITTNDVVDGAFIIQFSDTLVAELIIPNTLSVKTLGARSQQLDGTKYDLKPYLDLYINKIKSIAHKIKLFIPAGIWYCSPCDLTSQHGFDIEGEYSYYNYDANGTLITTLNDNQQYLLNIGTNIDNVYTKDFSLKNIMFSTFDYSYNSSDKLFKVSTPKTVTKCVVNWLYAIHGITDNLIFVNVQGEAMRMAGCWENKFPYLVFRYVSNPSGEIMSFRGDQSYGQYSSISSTEFGSIFFEGTHGDLIGLYNHSTVTNNRFNHINFEPSKFEYSSNEIEYASASELPASLTHLSIIKFKESSASFIGNVIGDINTNSFSNFYYTYNNTNYIYDTIISTGSGYNYLELAINNIINYGGITPIVILKNDSSNQIIQENYLHIGLISSSSSFTFDLNRNFSDLSYNGKCDKYTSSRINNSNIQKFYEYSVQNRGNVTLKTDGTGLFDNKIMIEFPQYNNDYQVTSCVTGSTLKVLAKIANGENCGFRWQKHGTSTGAGVYLTGTGDWSWYDVDVSSLTKGDLIDMKLAGSSAVQGLFDSFFFV